MFFIVLSSTMDSLDVLNELIILQSWNVNVFFNHYFGLLYVKV